MATSLIVLSPGKQQGKSISVLRFPFLIGRGAACQLRPASSLVSNEHCALVTEDGRIYIKDLGSTTGTKVDGERLYRALRLVGGERIEVGPLAFQVKIEQYAKVNEQTPLPPAKSTKDTTDEEAASILLYLTEDERGRRRGYVFDSDDIS
jgi:pSer/pThr/pTyr-binding forkhead associated (FHA) protein